MIKKLVEVGLKKMGYKLRKINDGNDPKALTMAGALRRCASRGIKINSVIDVGASDGRWSQLCMDAFPKAKYLLIEAQEDHKSELEQFSKRKNADYVLAAAGHREGKIYFDNTALFGGLASETPLDTDCIEVPVVTIDNEIERMNLEAPFLIKLDTHGFEVPILEGALKALEQAELVIIETYNYQLTDDSLKFYEMCEYMSKLGFRPIEMVDVLLRPYDNSFWQMDTFFVKSDRKEFSYNSYR